MELTQNQIDKLDYRKHCSRSCANSGKKNRGPKTKDGLDKCKKILLDSVKNSIKYVNAHEQYLKNSPMCKICGKKLMYEQRTNNTCSKKCLRTYLSIVAKKRYKKHPHKHPNRLCAGIKESYPEQMLREYLEQNGLIKDIDFIQQYKLNSYFVDFYIPKLNLGLEVDGERWHNRKSKREIKRENYIIEHIELIRFDAKKLINKQYELIINELIVEIKSG